MPRPRSVWLWLAAAGFVWLLLVVGGLAAIRLLTNVVRQNEASRFVVGSSRLLAGSYRLQFSGGFRRIVVLAAGPVSYDVWQAAPNATLEHLHFVLIPPAEHPAESLGYEIRSGAKHCGHAGLRLYRDASGKVFPNILVFRYDDVEQPFEWMGHAFSERDEQYDRLQEIAPLAKSARDSNFFERLDANSRLELTKDIPGCT